jgi:hypothetical protein
MKPLYIQGFLRLRFVQTIKGAVNNENFAVDELWINFKGKDDAMLNYPKTLTLS